MLKYIVLFLTIGLLVFTGCEIPLSPQAFSWEMVFLFSESGSPDAFCVGDGGFYIVSYDSLGAVIWYFAEANNDLNEIYRPSNASNTTLYTIDFLNGNVWAGGYRTVEREGDTVNIPVTILRYEGNWYENELPDSGGNFINGVFDIVGIPGAEPDCYVRTADGIALFKPLTGDLHFLNELEGYAGPVRTESGRFFCVRNDPSFRHFYVAVSDESGSNFVIEETPVTWGRFETFDMPARPDRPSEWGSPAGEGMAVFGQLGWEGDDSTDYTGLILRDYSPPGEGVYSLAFYSPRAPDFMEIRSCAFKDQLNGCLLGQETSVFCVNGEWLKETPSFIDESFYNAVINDGRYYVLGFYNNQDFALYRSWR